MYRPRAANLFPTVSSSKDILFYSLITAGQLLRYKTVIYSRAVSWTENKRPFSSSHPMLCLVNPPPLPSTLTSSCLGCVVGLQTLQHTPYLPSGADSVENQYRKQLFSMNLYDMFAQSNAWSILCGACSYLFCAATTKLALTLYHHCWVDLPSLLSTIKTHPVSKSKP